MKANINLNILKACVKSFSKADTAVSKAVENFTAEQENLKKGLVETLVFLKENFSTENSKAVLAELLPLGKDRVEGLFNSRLYVGSEYVTLNQIAQVKLEKGFIAMPAKVDVESIKAFGQAENGLTCPKPAKDTTKVKNLTAALATAVVGKPLPSFEKQSKPELTEAQKQGKKIKAAISSLEKAFVDLGEKEMLNILALLSQKATPLAEQLMAQDVFSSYEEEKFSVAQPQAEAKAEQQAA